MAGEIFISYRRADEAWARLLHGQLQAEGVEAWYDAQVGAGQDWRTATAKALQAWRIFVLLFSAGRRGIEDIAKELAAAIFAKKLIMPVRMENIEPNGAFLYELASRNWVNAFENTEAKLAELAQSLAKLVKSGIVDESIMPFDRNAGAKAPAREASWMRASLPSSPPRRLVMAAAAAALFWTHPRPRSPTQPRRRPRASRSLPFEHAGRQGRCQRTSARRSPNRSSPPSTTVQVQTVSREDAQDIERHRPRRSRREARRRNLS